jgi:GNAT superfamily N-acetyltransferase
MGATSNSPSFDGIAIRQAGLADASALASLATQLGYPSSTLQVENRMTAVLGDPKHHILVACLGDHVVGWAHAYLCCLLETDLYVELGGLVVDESRQGRGVGTKLLEQVEEWAAQMGARAVSVRSNIIRDQAHKFYRARGYGQIKTQHAFRRSL